MGLSASIHFLMSSMSTIETMGSNVTFNYSNNNKLLVRYNKYSNNNNNIIIIIVIIISYLSEYLTR